MSGCRPFLFLLLTLCAGAFGADLSIDEYRQELEKVQSALQQNQLEAAKNQSAKLLKKTILFDGEQIRPDGSILKPIANANDLSATDTSRVKLSTLLKEMSPAGAHTPPSNAVTTIDKPLLEQLREQEKLDNPEKGGETGQMPDIDDHGLGDLAWKAIKRVFKFLGGLVKSFVDWLFKLLPTEKHEPSEYIGPVTIMLVLAGVGLASLLILDAVRRRKAEAPLPAAAKGPLGSPRDADPMSKSANEWELYAARLAAARNFREAIRAWYHAVLVTLYRGGELHYRQGRTNWEYYYSLPQRMTWRNQFLDIIQRFEIEWYGKSTSNADDLADYSSRAGALIAELRQGKSNL